MTTAWIDTETTGLDPRDSGAFEIALLIYDGAKLLEEKLYHLNPLNDEIRFSEEAYQINGVSEETIRSYPPMEKVVPEIVELLKKHVPQEKYVFAGYNCNFDYGHLGALFFRCGFYIGDYFNEKFIDVLERVRMAREQGFLVLDRRYNNKLETITKALGITHDDAHTALSDIKATRQLYEALYLIWRKNK
ncbi:MAG: 3'-5' exonuclease [Oscillospiraceae bacterium]|jgi:DNA polymerase-3 subunit epsilon|nr:3'-5' exonuclease [Oscillospiraceae bacterium]